MKIAILAPVWFAVPPIGYGGIEWIVWLLADGLVDAGHDVTLFASGDSRTKARLAAVFPEALKMTADHGRLVLLGDTGTPELQHLTPDVIRRGLTIVGSKPAVSVPPSWTCFSPGP